MDTSYIINHLGEDRDEYYGAAVPPVFQSVNFAFPDVATMRRKLQNEMETPYYTRGYNPGVGLVRKKLAALEGTEDALIFSSGSAAVAAVVMSIVKTGDHVVSVSRPYSWTGNLFAHYLKKFNVEVSYVDGTVYENFEKAIKSNTTLIYLESPNSLTFELQDIEAIAKIAKPKKIITAIDNTYCSPLNQRPGAMGIDIIIHSATKYLSGHSDVVAGVVCGAKERISKMMSEEYMTLGAIASPYDAAALLKGLRTLELRVNKSGETAMKLVEFFQDHPKISKVYYPHSKNNPQLELAQKQMCRPGGMFSIELKVDKVEKVESFCNSLRRFLLATSWGGYESLAFPMCAIATSDSYKNKPVPWNMVRMYIGLEDAEVLKKDLENALSKI